MGNYPNEHDNIGGYIVAGIIIIVIILMVASCLFGRAIGAI